MLRTTGRSSGWRWRSTAAAVSPAICSARKPIETAEGAGGDSGLRAPPADRNGLSLRQEGTGVSKSTILVLFDPPEAVAAGQPDECLPPFPASRVLQALAEMVAPLLPAPNATAGPEYSGPAGIASGRPSAASGLLILSRQPAVRKVACEPTAGARPTWRGWFASSPSRDHPERAR